MAAAAPAMSGKVSGGRDVDAVRTETTKKYIYL